MRTVGVPCGYAGPTLAYSRCRSFARALSRLRRSRRTPKAPSARTRSLDSAPRATKRSAADTDVASVEAIPTIYRNDSTHEIQRESNRVPTERSPCRKTNPKNPENPKSRSLPPCPAWPPSWCASRPRPPPGSQAAPTAPPRAVRSVGESDRTDLAPRTAPPARWRPARGASAATPRSRLTRRARDADKRRGHRSKSHGRGPQVGEIRRRSPPSCACSPPLASHPNVFLNEAT
eukprot:139449-Prorocentrum_minimum.AAC.3